MQDMRAVWVVDVAHLGHTHLKHFVTVLTKHFLTALRRSIAALLALLLETKLSLDAQRCARAPRCDNRTLGGGVTERSLETPEGVYCFCVCLIL